ncbi:MAG TPA: class I SAM-dependent DNA methyltransferase [Bacillota bacterium]|jgi:type I restriction enzyme M protein|nr:class I SAM-dependent DNA methyltransferase [Bacillota bacterium]HNT03027.1 class I SAM-dependent DNA methyltransferase [Bacillota bacterium]HPA54139.1 class I SAM-dependent DNA methyltransferase [Bacillota bacterium]HPX67717.1 class I SAM-dependent DNA methyltransferase [Bacillota bacterium]HQA65095.1 class I SAM-dependent DNA methyltransferase [Bacillota bacterium]
MINQADINAKVNLVTKIANKLRGPYTSEQYGSVIIPMSILRRFDCVLEGQNSKIKLILEKFKSLNVDEKLIEQAVQKECGIPFYNKKCVTFEDLISDSDNINANFMEFLTSYSPSIANIIKGLKFKEEVEFMIKKGILFEVVKAFSEVDFHPDTTDQLSMGYIFEEIIRTYKSNAEAGDHYTPREVIELCVELMVAENIDELKKEGKIIRVYDGCCGTGGMLTVTKRKLGELLGSDERVRLFGQDNNPEAYAICCAEMLMLGEDVKNIYEGNTLTEDHLKGEKFDILITNPPFGVEWKTEKAIVEKELNSPNNRFVAGTPRVSDGQLLFLQNLLAKAEKNARIAIILNGSPLFSGDAESGESEIRRYVLENNLLEAIVALPDQMFYNTGIFSYIWILSRNKSEKRDKKVQLINAVDFWEPQQPKSLGNKRKFISPHNRKKIVELYSKFEENEYSRKFDNIDFGYHKVTIERPLRDETGAPIIKKGKVQADGALRDTENIPLKEDINEYFNREVKPYAPDAWIDHDKIKVGYEIPFTRYFYKYVPPRKSGDILSEIIEIEDDIKGTIETLLGRRE